MKAGFVSLGCSKNLVDTEMMLGILREHGIEITSQPKEADILIVNTCAFIQSAKEESITTILDMAEFKESGRCRSLIVAGCLGQRYKQELLDDMPEADAIIGTGAWNRIMEAVRETLKGNRVVIAGEDELLYDEHTPRITTTPAYTAYVKIAEGCNNRCAFCAIPMIRGKYRSRKIEDIKDEVANLAKNGVKEIVLIAQDSTEYGRDIYGKPCLAKLLRELCAVEDVQWIRTLYSYPTYFDDELIETIATEPKLVKYFDIPFQHINDEILKKMNRHTDGAYIRKLVTHLRERVPGAVFRTSLITGLPGEGEAEFEELCEFLKEYKLERVGAFVFSPEEGTRAAEMEYPDTEIARERAERVAELQSRIMDEYNERCLGETMEALCEGYDPDEGSYFGRTYADSPDVDGKIWFTSEQHVKTGDFVRVRIVDTYDGELVAIAEDDIDDDGE